MTKNKVVFHGLEKTWAELTQWSQMNPYREFNYDTVYRVFEDYLAACGNGQSFAEEELKPLVKEVIQHRDATPELIRPIVEFFLAEDVDREGYSRRTSIVAVFGLRNTACPADLLSRAAVGGNRVYAMAAIGNPNCPAEDQVYGALMWLESFS